MWCLNRYPPLARSPSRQRESGVNQLSQESGARFRCGRACTGLCCISTTCSSRGRRRTVTGAARSLMSRCWRGWWRARWQQCGFSPLCAVVVGGVSFARESATTWPKKPSHGVRCAHTSSGRVCQGQYSRRCASVVSRGGGRGGAGGGGVVAGADVRLGEEA